MFPPYEYQDYGFRTSGAYEPNFLWDTRILTLAFFNGDCRERAMVRMVASEWTPYSNIDFVFIDDTSQADIRVGFYKHLKDSWSYIGTESKEFSVDVNNGMECRRKGGVSMNFACLDRSTILHEFGRK